MERYNRPEVSERPAKEQVRTSYVWKTERIGMAVQIGWLITTVFLLAMWGKNPSRPMPYLWCLWLLSCAWGLILHIRRKPDAGNERLLGGAFGVIAIMISCAGMSNWKLIVCPVLMGLSNSLTGLSWNNRNVRKAVCFFGVEDEEARKMIRSVPMSLYFVGGALLLLSFWVLQLNQVPFGYNLLALTMIVTLTVNALNDPLDRRTMQKIDRYDAYMRSGRSCEATQKWIQSAIVEKHRRPWFIYLLIQILTVFYRHRVIGLENVRIDDENPIVYLANHGEIYGPVVAKLFTPTYVRPWSISYIMTDMKETVEYLYKYTFSRQTWLLKPLRLPLTRVMSAFAHWGLRALEAIPVFRDQPAKLRQTFRDAVETMQNGDDMLIFPENPNAVSQDHGYERNGVGELFSGFAMLAPIYYNRTGKCCRFVPMYIHNPSRTVSFGTEIVYDPDNDPMTERDRMVSEAKNALNRMSTELEEKYQKSLNEKKHK